jgi:hypothetical protein
MEERKWTNEFVMLGKHSALNLIELKQIGNNICMT